MLDTSDLPGGVINIVTGQRDVLSRTLVEHQEVDSMWYFGDAKGSYHVELLSAKNMKRTFVSYGEARDWHDAEQGEGHEFLHEAVEARTSGCRWARERDREARRAGERGSGEGWGA